MKKPIKESSTIIIQQMSHEDANLAGNIHGGAIMKLIDNTAGIVAARHSQGLVVTASIDQLDFHSPVHVGDLLYIKASINYTGNSSMEVGVRVEAENFITGERRHTASAYLILVALGDDGKPKQVPQAIFESDDEKRRNRDAINRKKLREKGSC